MNSTVLNLYNVSFNNIIIDDNNGLNAYTKKLASSSNYLLGSFLTSWNSVEEIDEELLPTIEIILNGTQQNDYTDSAIVWVDIYPNITKFYKSGAGVTIDLNFPDYEIPTSDFKEIVLSWREFLSSSPLNKTTL